MMQRNRQGFTLIELSIVLVIIGLIIGGVLVGRDLISAAAERAQISQIERYNVAVNTFYGKYGWLPGDIKDPQASSFGFIARGVNPGEGDGNGVIQGYGFGYYGGITGCGACEQTGETGVFWVDLSAAHMIDGGFSALNNATNYSNGVAVNLCFPSAKIGNGNYIYVYSGGAAVSGNWLSDGVNYFGVSAVTAVGGTVPNSTPGLTVKQAYDIDSKVDDGLPQSGKVKAVYVDFTSFSMSPGYGWAGSGGTSGNAAYTTATPGTSATCFDNGGSTTGATQQYSMSQNNGTGLNCALSFQMQGAAR